MCTYKYNVTKLFKYIIKTLSTCFLSTALYIFFLIICIALLIYHLNVHELIWYNLKNVSLKKKQRARLADMCTDF